MLTAKEENFCVNVAIKNMTQTDAYKNSYNAENMSDKVICNKASLLMQKGDIRVRIEQLRKEANSEAILSAIERKKWLSDVITNQQQEDIYFKGEDGVETKIGSKNADLNTKMKAMDILNKMDGEYIEKLKLGNDDDKPFEINIKVIK